MQRSLPHLTQIKTPTTSCVFQLSLNTIYWIMRSRDQFVESFVREAPPSGQTVISPLGYAKKGENVCTLVFM